MALSDPNSLNVAVSTTSDNSGLTSAGQAVESYAAKLEVARQRVSELSQTENVKTSTMMAATNAVTNYEQKFDTAFQKMEESNKVTEEATTKTQGLSSAVLLGQAAYNALYGVLQRGEQFFASAIDSANKYQMAIAGLNSTSRSMGDNIDQTTQAAQKLSSDGLIPITQSATSLRNLLASGFSLPQAIQLLDALKDKMAFNRQGYDNMGDAVVHATKGIELGNTKMLEATGVNVKLNAMLKENGVATSALGNLQESAAARQAIVNGVTQNAAGNFGDAAKASEVFGAKQAAAGTAVENLKISLGGVEQLIGGALLPQFTKFLGTNQKMIVDFGAATVVAGGLAAAIFAVGMAVEKFSMDSIIAVATNPLLLALSAIAVMAGVVVYNAMDKLQTKAKEMNLGLAAGADTTGNLKNKTDQLTASQQSLADKLQQVDEQIAKSNRDFQESLAKTIQGVQDKVASLNEQMGQENSSFADSQTKKLKAFNNTEDSMNTAHDKRVDSIQKQLDKETALGKWADQQKLQDLQQQLKDENDQYNQQMTDKQATYNQDVADAKKAHDEKVSDLQKQLDTENNLLSKHAADVASVRNVMMLDEIEKIKQTHDDQLKSLDDQKQKAVQSAQQTVQGVNNAYSTGLGSDAMKSQMSNIGSMMGTSMGNALKQYLIESIKDLPKQIGSLADKWGNEIAKNDTLMGWLQKAAYNLAPGPTHKATGGSVAAGQSYLVGDNPDGSINSTTEMFVPSQSGTILSAPQTRSLLSGGGKGGVTINQTNHIYSQVDMDAANTLLGWKLVNA